MEVKTYDPKGKKDKKSPAKKIKAVLAKKSTRIILFALSGALLLAAAAIFLIQWNEGEAAAEKAEELLTEVGMQPSALSDPFPAVSGVYVQPQEPDVQSEEDIAGILETELQGYTVIARLDIEKLGLQLPVLSKWSTKALKVSVCYYSGPAPGEDGNLVITGHNYRSGAHFGKLDKMEAGDTVTLTDVEGNTYEYKVYKTELIKPDNPKALDKTKYDNELTLLTCEARGNRRLLVRCALASLF
jgi:LPXTG-site transpeptidase (sortase) family protein